MDNLITYQDEFLPIEVSTHALANTPESPSYCGNGLVLVRAIIIQITLYPSCQFVGMGGSESIRHKDHKVAKVKPADTIQPQTQRQSRLPTHFSQVEHNNSIDTAISTA